MMKTEMEKKMYLSTFPPGTMLPARHYVTRQKNKVKVGKVFIGTTAGETIQQPLYLRQGCGIYLRKCQKPRRKHYGREPSPERVVFHASECQDYSGSMRRALFTHGVIMTNKPITVVHLDPQFHALAKPVPSEERLAIQAAVERDPDLMKIVTRNRESRRLEHPVITEQSPLFTYVDKEDWKPPPPYFVPLPTLSSPPINIVSYSSSSSSSIHLDEKPLLLRPELPIMRISSIDSQIWTNHSGRLSTSTVPLQEEQKLWEAWQKQPQQKPERARYHLLPSFVPHVVLPSSSRVSTSEPPDDACHVQITSSRGQEGLVNLEDMFPYKADEGLLAEIDFYQQEKNFPLLVTRNPDVDPEKFEDLNSARKLPPEQVVRVRGLTKKVLHQNALTEEVTRDDSDLEDEDTYAQDKVFNPLSYPFNKPVYKTVKRLTKDGKL